MSVLLILGRGAGANARQSTARRGSPRRTGAPTCWAWWDRTAQHVGRTRVLVDRLVIAGRLLVSRQAKESHLREVSPTRLSFQGGKHAEFLTASPRSPAGRSSGRPRRG